MQEYSQRIKDRLSNPRFIVKTDESFLEKPFFFHCLFNHHNNDPIPHLLENTEFIHFYGQTSREGIIESLCYHTSLTDFHLAFIDVFVQFALKKKRHALFSINLREIENYLRDQNESSISLPSYLNDWISRWANQLVWAVGKSLDTKEDEIISFTSLFTLMDKIYAVKKVLDRHIRPLLHLEQGDVELIDIRGEEITLCFKGRCRHCPGVLGGTRQLVEDILKEKLQIPNLKLVAE